MGLGESVADSEVLDLVLRRLGLTKCLLFDIYGDLNYMSTAAWECLRRSVLCCVMSAIRVA